MKKKNRIITINGDKMSWYEKAIFVTKKDSSKNEVPDDFIIEAENIINQYLVRTGFENVNRKNVSNKKIVRNDKIDMFLYYSIVFCCFTLVFSYISLLI